MKSTSNIIVVFVALLMCLSTLAPHQADAAPDGRCFREVEDCIRSRFRSYWEQSNGLANFGFPILPQAVERDVRSHGSRPIQWFERARLEIHDENVPPYDVQLGRIGAEVLRLQGIDVTTLARDEGPVMGCMWFEETGHNVCDQEKGLGFMTYWKTNGIPDVRLAPASRSLALFGLPLTSARLEPDQTGKLILTQWFERARFEWHPEFGKGYEVTLGLLGSILHNQQILDMKPIVSSTFDEGTEGWTVRYDAQNGLPTPDYHTTGGYPGGYVSATDDVDSLVWYWNAPPQFLGNVSAAYGRSLCFSMKQSSTKRQIQFPDVILVGNNIWLDYNLEYHPDIEWTTFSIRLEEHAGWINRATGQAPTREEMQAVLESLSRIRIRGEYTAGYDVGGIDNVLLGAVVP